MRFPYFGSYSVLVSQLTDGLLTADTMLAGVFSPFDDELTADRLAAVGLNLLGLVPDGRFGLVWFRLGLTPDLELLFTVPSPPVLLGL